MSDTVTFDLVSPERLLRSSDVYMVVVPGAEGDFGVLARHAPFMSTLRPGPVDIYATEGAAPERVFVGGGFAEVADNRLTILAEDATPLADVDVEAVSQELANAREDLGDAKDERETAKIEANIERLETLIALVRN